MTKNQSNGHRRVLGNGPSLLDAPKMSHSQSDTTSSSTNKNNDGPLLCPICNDQMITLSQLNQHIDDMHSGSPGSLRVSMSPHKAISANLSDIVQPQANITPTKRKMNKITYFNQGFSLSDEQNEFMIPMTATAMSPSKDSQPNSAKLIRSHWKTQAQDLSSKCNIKNCDKTLNVKNGIVNCRKCGKLFCNEHTHYKVRLRNPVNGEPKAPQYESSCGGVWGRCCMNCYYDKPDLKQGTTVNYTDLTVQFKFNRQAKVDIQQLNRNKVQKNFIKLTSLLVETEFKKHPTNSNNRWNFFNINNQPLLQNEQEIIGGDNWQADTDVTNCSICFVRFNLFIRRHHCRLCGKIVCDDPNGFRKSCSILVPISKLMEKLPKLNYSLYIRNHFEMILHDESIKFRCCRECKNALLYDWKLQHKGHEDDEIQDIIFTMYESILLQKKQIEVLLPKYETLIYSDDELSKTKLRSKLMVILKDFEGFVIQFRDRFFIKNSDTILVNPKYNQYQKLISNIYQSIAVFLQDNIIQYKQISEVHREQEQIELNRVQKENTPEIPRLTKKQIREMREQLMVMNEQKFLVENLIKDCTKGRRFDELDSLLSNKKELEDTIENLEKELGEFGFSD